MISIDLMVIWIWLCLSPVLLWHYFWWIWEMLSTWHEKFYLFILFQFLHLELLQASSVYYHWRGKKEFSWYFSEIWSRKFWDIKKKTISSHYFLKKCRHLILIHMLPAFSLYYSKTCFFLFSLAQNFPPKHWFFHFPHLYEMEINIGSLK